MDIFYGFVGVGGGKWRYFLGGWGWVNNRMGGWKCVEVYFGWLGVGRHFLWVSGSLWWWVEVYFGRVGAGGHFLWVSGGVWWWVEIYFGWVGPDVHFLWVSGGR